MKRRKAMKSLRKLEDRGCKDRLPTFPLCGVERQRTGGWLMFTTICLASLVGLMFGHICYGDESILQEFRSDAGRFSVIAPVVLKETTMTFDSGLGKIEYHTFRAERRNVQWTVTYADLPELLVQGNGHENIFDGSRDSIVDDFHGKVVHETKIMLDGNPGREVEAEATGQFAQDLRVKCRIFCIKNRLYHVMMIAPKEHVTVSKMDEFLNSFKLLSQSL
jgi:hypothetical protein